MSLNASSRLSLVLIGCLLVGLTASATAADNTELKAGAAARVVNPTKPAATIGHRVMTMFLNVYADLRVQALVLEDASGKRIVWLGYDFCVPPAPMVDRIKKRIHAEHGIPPEAVAVNASHTHSAPPLTRWEAVADEHFDPQYADFVVREAAAVVGDALSRMAPARLRYAQATSAVGINRRGSRDGRVGLIPRPEGVVDRRVQLVVAENKEDGNLIGVAVKYACHPVTVVNTGIGSDYPGYMRQFVENRHPGAVAVFLQGCGADVNSLRPNEEMTGWVRGSPETAEEFGRELADTVDRALDEPGTPITGPIEFEYAVVNLPMEKVAAEKYEDTAQRNDPFAGQWGKMYAEKVRRGDEIPETWPYRIQAFRLGSGQSPFTLVALDGEVFTEYGLNLERMLRPAPTIVLGYTNGVVSYLFTAAAIAEGGYELNAYRWFRLPGPYTAEAESIVLEATAELARAK